MDSGRPPPSIPAEVLAALHASSQPKPAGYPHPQYPTVDPASLHALLYAQQARGWLSPEYGYPNMAPFLPPGGPIQPTHYAALSGMIHPQQLHAQQLLALQQAQAQAGYVLPQEAYQLVHPPTDLVPAKDPFVYVQQEVRAAAVDPAVVEGIRKRALFVAPAVKGIRIPQACERCRKRKTRCTGEKPKCNRCSRRNFECEYVWDHRANKTKKAVAEREKAMLEAEAAGDHDQAQAMLVNPAALQPCPPAGLTYTSSSGYSDAGVSSLPPPVMAYGPYAGGQPHCPPAGPSQSGSSEGSAGSLPPPLPTPAIMLDGRVLGSPQMHPPAPQGAKRPPPRARARTSKARANHATPAPSTSLTSDLGTISRSTSALSLQHPPTASSSATSLQYPPTASPSCQACLSEMVDCTACVMERESLRPQRDHAGIATSRSMPAPMHSMTVSPVLPSYVAAALPEPEPHVKQILLDAVTRALAKQAPGAAAATPAATATAASTPSSLSDDAGATPPVPPLLARGGASSSSSGASSEGQSRSGAQTPHDYFALPGMQCGPPGAGAFSAPQAAAAEDGPHGMKASESMMVANAYQGMYGCPPAEDDGHVPDGEGAVSFSEYFYPFEPAAGSTHATRGYTY